MARRNTKAAASLNLIQSTCTDRDVPLCCRLCPSSTYQAFRLNHVLLLLLQHGRFIASPCKFTPSSPSTVCRRICPIIILNFSWWPGVCQKRGETYSRRIQCSVENRRWSRVSKINDSPRRVFSGALSVTCGSC